MDGQDKSNSRKVRHYFVDEAGDGVLFDRKGRHLVGCEGCSRYFILGHAHVDDPSSLGLDLELLRQDLLKDPYFRRVPSMQPAAGKTARFFHAKDDLPEVRREVFAVLRKHSTRFYAAVRSKQALLEYVARRNQSDPSYRYSPNELYDGLVRKLFVGRLHQADEYEIVFARRGKSDRTAALTEALEAARKDFYFRHRIPSRAVLTIVPSHPWETPSLQATDYLLWALQRFYEQSDGRYVELMWPAFRLVRDLDDTRRKRGGELYTQKRPLVTAAS